MYFSKNSKTEKSILSLLVLSLLSSISGGRHSSSSSFHCPWFWNIENTKCHCFCFSDKPEDAKAFQSLPPSLIHSGNQSHAEGFLLKATFCGLWGMWAQTQLLFWKNSAVGLKIAIMQISHSVPSFYSCYILPSTFLLASAHFFTCSYFSALIGCKCREQGNNSVILSTHGRIKN